MLRVVFSIVLASTICAGAFAQGWLCYGGNPQHTGLYTGTSQSAQFIKWQAPMDDDRNYYGSIIYGHFAAPMVTPSNSVVYGYRYTTNVDGSSDYNNWKIIARKGATGSVIWQMNTDYTAPEISPYAWTSVYPTTLYQLSATTTARGMAVAGAGGTIYVRSSADATTSATTRMVFYETLATYSKKPSTYAGIMINTPLTSDTAGNIYFGYLVNGTLPTSLAKVGTGGIAKVNAKTGAVAYTSVESMGIDPTLIRPAMNCAPALSLDQSSIYVGVMAYTDVNNNFSYGNSYLAKLSTKTLAVEDKVQIMDPYSTGKNAYLIDESSASPMVGPDGHVYMGVFGYSYRNSEGWMLQFDENLDQYGPGSIRYPVGAFGWDDTAVVVPSTMVPSYTGTAKYLILTKFNNYNSSNDPGDDGTNRVAVLDPTSNSTSVDRLTGLPVMNEILTVLGPTHNGGTSNPVAVCEWCINSAAVDVNRKSAILNSEDGHMYRWSFVSNTLTEAIDLAPATSEAYTMTAIGPDGQIYAINNTVLFALGTYQATSVSVVQGTGTTGNLTDILYMDGETYSTKAVSTLSGQTATIEADFTLPTTSVTALNIVSNVSAVAGVRGTLSAYSYSKKAFEIVGSQDLSATLGSFNVSVTTGASQYVGPGGKVRLRFEGLLPTEVKTPFPLAIDMITCQST